MISTFPNLSIFSFPAPLPACCKSPGERLPDCECGEIRKGLATTSPAPDSKRIQAHSQVDDCVSVTVSVTLRFAEPRDRAWKCAFGARLLQMLAVADVGCLHVTFRLQLDSQSLLLPMFLSPHIGIARLLWCVVDNAQTIFVFPGWEIRFQILSTGDSI